MKECLECRSNSIRYERNIRAFVCEKCGFTITKADLYKLFDKRYTQRKTKEEEKEELYKWFISSKK